MSDNDVKRGLVNYSSRDYTSLKESFFDLVPKLTELWKPESAADPGVVLGQFLASVGDMLNVNQDVIATEMYAPSTAQRKTAEKLFGLLGYELGFYRAARTEVTFTNNSEEVMELDFGFNGANFATLNAYTDITNTSRVITYNILPLTSTYGDNESRSRRSLISDSADVFVSHDKVKLGVGSSVTRVAIEGELRNYSVPVSKVKENNYIIKLPSQHVDTTAVWIKASTSTTSDNYAKEQWVQVASPSDFITPEPRFAVTYDSYSNAQIQISNYLDVLENYDNNYIIVYWIDCSGVIGCVGTDVLSNFLPARTESSFDSDLLTITNLSNTTELPHTYTVTGSSPETAKEAYANSRNYVNTSDSLITLPDFNKFLLREAGVDTGLVIDCQKALELNLSVYNDKNLTDSQKAKKYITNYDFPQGDPIYDWSSVLGLGFDPTDPQKFVFAANFKRYTAMCFAIHNNFQDSKWGKGQTSQAKILRSAQFDRYKPPTMFIEAVKRDYAPLQAMSVDLQFGYLRLFSFRVIGTIRTVTPVSADVAENIIAKAKEALAFYYHPSARRIGVQPQLSEILDVVEGCDSRIRHFDPGSIRTDCIVWEHCDIEYFNAISFARYDDNSGSTDIRIDPSYIID